MGLGDFFDSAVNVASLGLIDTSPPPQPGSPDYAGAAEATAEGNIEAARVATMANRPTQITPWGTSTWTQDPENQDMWTQNVQLSPEQQNLFDLQQQTGQRMGEVGLAGLNSASSLFSNRYQTPDEAALPTYGENREQVIDAMMQRSGRALDQEREAVHSQLISQGIPPGSEAYNREMRRIDEKSVDARQQAEINAANMATQEYRTGMDRAQQLISDALLERQTPLNELNALRTGAQVSMPQFGNFSNQQTTAGPDIMSATMAQGQWDQNAWNASVARDNAIMSGIFGLGASAVGAG